MSDEDEPQVVVLVTAGCHLCEDACAVVADVCASSGISWSARDLAEIDEATRSKWREFVPVVLIGGEVHDIFRVSAERLRAALA
jgi:coenzyme F420-reducing hydrogenase beta subunit